MNVIKAETNTDTSVRGPAQVLHPVHQIQIQNDGVVRREISTAVVRRKGKGGEKRKTRK